MNRTYASTLALVIASATATPSLAQSDPTTPAQDNAGNDIVVTASRSGDGIAARDLPASVTLIADADLQRRQTRVVSDILRDVPGLAVNRTGGVGSPTQVRIRGTEGNHVLVLIDGVEVSDPYQGEFDLGGLLADEGARIEVLRGQQSSLYGSDAIGGVIHYITQTGREAPGVSLRAEGGTMGTAAGAARVAGFGDTLDYALSGSAYHTGGYPTARGGTRDVGATLANATAKLSWAPSASFKLTGVGRYGHTRAETNSSESDPASPRYGFIVDSPGEYFRNNAYHGLVRADLSLSGGRWNSALSGQVTDATRKGYAADALAFGNNGRRYKGTFETSLRFGGDRMASRVTGAVDFEREEFENLTPQSASFPFFRGRRATRNLGFVGQYELSIDDTFSAGASLRRDENDRFDDVTTYRVQAGYRVTPGLRLRGAYGTGVKNPGFFDLFGFQDGRYIGNPDLRPEKSEGWEAGLDREVAAGRATIGLTYFDSELRDEIFATNPPPDFVTTPANRSTRSRQRGVEAFASARPNPQLRFDLAYTYLKAREDGVEEVRRPRHVGSVNTTVLSADQRSLATLTVRYNGRQSDITFTDPSFATSPVVSLQEYVLVNLNAEHALTDRIALFGRVENLTGEDFEEVFSFASAGRAAYAGVKARF